MFFSKVKPISWKKICFTGEKIHQNVDYFGTLTEYFEYTIGAFITLKNFKAAWFNLYQAGWNKLGIPNLKNTALNIVLRNGF